MPQAEGPIFERIAAALRADITAGRLQPGQLLPSETQLSQQHGISPKTARASVRVLRAEGLAELVFGRGVVVRQPTELEDLVLPASATLTARMPTVEERRAYEIPDGVPIFVVALPDTSVQVYPADRWKVRLP